MGSRAWLLLLAAVAAGCGSSADDGSGEGVTTADDLTDPVGVLEQRLTPPLPAPSSPLIGASMADVLNEAMRGLASKQTTRDDDGCTMVRMFDAQDVLAVEHLTCSRSEVVRILGPDGRTKAEHLDFNKDGKVDRYSSEEGRVAQFTDSNFDGKIDVVVERVALLDDFSLEGYGDYPKSAFLFRVRESFMRDGFLHNEKLTAKGALAK